jgi:hypothetical protein
MEQFSKLLNPAVEKANGLELTYFIVAGDDTTCARYARGNVNNMTAMLVDMAQKHPWMHEVLTRVGQELSANELLE